MTQLEAQCLVCAWRVDCRKKYSIQSENGKVKCPDFARDVTIKPDRDEDDDK